MKNLKVIVVTFFIILIPSLTFAHHSFSRFSKEIKKVTLGKDYVFCLGDITLTLYDSGVASLQRHGLDGSTLKTLIGEWKAYGLQTDMPGQTIKITYQNGTDDTYTLIRDGYGTPSVLLDSRGRRYELCQSGNNDVNSKKFPDLKKAKNELTSFQQLKLSHPEKFANAPKSIVIGSLDVSTMDLGEGTLMSYWEAKDECVRLGDGWRLPTVQECNLLYLNRTKLGIKINEPQHFYQIWTSSTCDTCKNKIELYSFDSNKAYPVESSYNHVELARIVRNHKFVFSNIEVAPEDLKINHVVMSMTWNKANQLLTALGQGWRFPTKEELKILKLHAAEIGNFDKLDTYFSSSTNNDNLVYSECFFCNLPGLYLSKSVGLSHVRLVRDVNVK